MKFNCFKLSSTVQVLCSKYNKGGWVITVQSSVALLFRGKGCPWTWWFISECSCTVSKTVTTGHQGCCHTDKWLFWAAPNRTGGVGKLVYKFLDKDAWPVAPCCDAGDLSLWLLNVQPVCSLTQNKHTLQSYVINNHQQQYLFHLGSQRTLGAVYFKLSEHWSRNCD